MQELMADNHAGREVQNAADSLDPWVQRSQCGDDDEAEGDFWMEGRSDSFDGSSEGNTSDDLDQLLAAEGDCGGAAGSVESALQCGNEGAASASGEDKDNLECSDVGWGGAELAELGSHPAAGTCSYETYAGDTMLNGVDAGDTMLNYHDAADTMYEGGLEIQCVMKGEGRQQKRLKVAARERGEDRRMELAGSANAEATVDIESGQPRGRRSRVGDVESGLPVGGAQVNVGLSHIESGQRGRGAPLTNRGRPGDSHAESGQPIGGAAGANRGNAGEVQASAGAESAGRGAAGSSHRTRPGKE